MIDSSTYPVYIGCARTGENWFNRKMYGFLYELHIYQSKHSISYTDHTTACVNCITHDFNFFDDSGAQECTGNNCSDRSCVKSGECQLPSICDSGNEFCHLCKDRECTLCDTYDLCNTAKCQGSTNLAAESAGECSCVSGAGRPDLPDGFNHLCQSCHIDCLTCDVGGLTEYSDCKSCGNGNYELVLNATYKYCANYCPTNFTTSGAPG